MSRSAPVVRGTLRLWPSLRKALRAFGGWWLPLCLVAGAILMTQSWIPRVLLGRDAQVLTSCRQAWKDWSPEPGRPGGPASVLAKMGTMLRDTLDGASVETAEAVQRLLLRFVWASGALFLVGCFLHTLMIILSRASVQQRPEDRRVGHNLRRGPVLAFSYAVLAFVKMAPFVLGAIAGACAYVATGFRGFWFFVPLVPALYLYVRLFFTGFVITDRSADPVGAVVESWRMTRGHLPALTILLAAELAIFAFSLFTVIGFIPATSFKYTLRASVYEQLRDAVSAPAPAT